MAVKQKNVLGPVPSSPEVRLQIILRALQGLQARDGTQVQTYGNIVTCLGTVAVPSDPTSYMKFIEDVKSVQGILMKECANNSNEVIFVTLKALYDEISNPTKSPSPVMSIVLQLISIEDLSAAVKFILNSGYPEQSLETALHTLCTWLTKWTYTENLGPLVLAFMRGLEQEHFYDILIDVTLSTIEPLFKLVLLPASRRCVWPVVHHMLSRVQHNPQAFHKIVPHTPKVIKMIAKDEAGKACLLQLINLLNALMEHFAGYPELYAPVQDAIKASRQTNNFKNPLNCNSWSNSASVVTPVRSLNEKVGLYNLGNTCYMNSVLQALYMSKAFRNQVLLQSETMLPLFSKLQILFALLQHSKKFCLSPNDILTLLRPPGFVLGHQHDSSEFLGYLLDTLHEQEKSKTCVISSSEGEEAAAEPPLTVVQQSFGGKTVTVSRCAECGTKSERIDEFRDLQLSIPQNVENNSVQSLLEYFLQSEKLCGDNQYRCDTCDRLTDGERITKIVSIPSHLILTLKHFRFDSVSQTRTKLLQRVNLESRICLEGSCFDLYAAVVHCGNTVDSGHYYTFARDSTGWYKFNDSTVSKTTEQNLHTVKPPETPYILFYAREDMSEPENLPCNRLSLALQTAVTKDQSENDMEQKNRILGKDGNAANKQRKNDDPPPPGCGGGGFGTPSGNMFVC
ncbi:ubiquitin carboxyl-terminal hydrolase 35 [Sitophilus oryzae]|uniref:Ubiquitin carboxyl-terminal hydrolase 35 n=1 Tax=Sitophilus oryzae TaxID=7048 RepID=A0A6J2XJ05_SITOR|nr:ubiquitin carboxyl-terminal hydrolase 35 [Sitophilus oryzae]XP_030751448.1 ubiquitin carboxyl-terminal hydrolase 35 [Sitophilus oryzae]